MAKVSGKSIGRLLGATALICSLSTPAIAQSAADQDDTASQSGALPDIIVTAQKRSEVITRVPAAISAINQAGLDSVGASTLSAATQTVPSLSVAAGQGLSIRGIGSATLTGATSTVAFQIDGIYESNLGAPNTSQLWDIERIEVLRGPQGTLYGQNATAGVVNVITAKPTNRFTAFGDFAVGNFGQKTLRAAVNLPITDTLAIRLAGTRDTDDGWQKDPAGGERLGSRDYTTGRAALRWAPVDGLVWNVNYSVSNNRSRVATGNPYYYASFPDAPGSFANPVTYPTHYPTDVAFVSPNQTAFASLADSNQARILTHSVRSNLRYDLNKNLALTYIFGFQYIRNNSATNGLVGSQFNHGLHNRFYSHEVNLNYESERFHAVVGLYSYRNTDYYRYVSHITLPGLSTSPSSPPVEGPTIDQQAIFDQTQSTKAVFGQATFGVTPGLRLTGGLRYNSDKVIAPESFRSQCLFGQIVDFQNFGPPLPAGALFPGSPPFSSFCSALEALTGGQLYVNKRWAAAQKSFRQVSWKAGVEYDFNPDVLLYANVATGYKAGGIGEQTAASAVFYNPEKDINFEAGIRSRWFNNRLTLNLTGFWTDYTDLQVSRVGTVNGAPAFVFTNAGKARSRGIELEGIWAPTPRDRLQGYVTYLDAKFLAFDTSDNFLSAPGGPPVPYNAAGNPLPFAPKFAFRLAYSHIFDLGSAGTLTPNISTHYQSKSYASYLAGAAYENEARWRSDLLVRYETEDKHFSLEGFVNNIENNQPPGFAFGIAGALFRSFGKARTYGVRAGVRF